MTNNYELEGVPQYEIKFTDDITCISDNKKIPSNLMAFEKINYPVIGSFYFKILIDTKSYILNPQLNNFEPCFNFECTHAKMYITPNRYVVFTETNGNITSAGLYKNTL